MNGLIDIKLNYGSKNCAWKNRSNLVVCTKYNVYPQAKKICGTQKNKGKKKEKGK